MLTTTLMSDVACETCQWRPVADVEAGICVRSITKFRTDLKKLFWFTGGQGESPTYSKAGPTGLTIVLSAAAARDVGVGVWMAGQSALPLSRCYTRTDR